jgi:hypothetical protein
MNVFELDADLIARYEKFARSFTVNGGVKVGHWAEQNQAT